MQNGWGRLNTGDTNEGRGKLTKTGSETPNSVKRLKIAIQNTKLIQFNSVQAYLHSIRLQQQSSQDALCKDPTALGKTTTIKWLWQWEVKNYNGIYAIVTGLFSNVDSSFAFPAIFSLQFWIYQYKDDMRKCTKKRKAPKNKEWEEGRSPCILFVSVCYHTGTWSHCN